MSHDSTSAIGQDGGAWVVAQSVAANLRAQTASESTAGAAAPTTASAIGTTDGTNLRIPWAYAGDTSGGGAEWLLGAQLRVGAWDASQPVTFDVSTVGGIGVTVAPMNRRNLTSPTTTAVSCGTTATAAPASVRSQRVNVTFFNNSAVTIYLGGSGVTTANGLPVLANATLSLDAEQTPYYCVVATGTADLRVLEN